MDWHIRIRTKKRPIWSKNRRVNRKTTSDFPSNDFSHASILELVQNTTSPLRYNSWRGTWKLTSWQTFMECARYLWTHTFTRSGNKGIWKRLLALLLIFVILMCTLCIPCEAASLFIIHISDNVQTQAGKLYGIQEYSSYWESKTGYDRSVRFWLQCDTSKSPETSSLRIE